MDFPLENCIVAGSHFPAPLVQKLLQYPHPLTYVLLDLQLLEEEVIKMGEKAVIANTLSGDELDMLSKFTLAKRKREWLGGRFAAKYATQRLLEHVESQQNAPGWSSYTILADKNSRPFLSATKENATQPCDISISHSASMAAAMVVHRGYCGVDIQQITPKIFKVSDRFCTHDEKQILQDFFPLETEKQAALLTKLWAAKEALRKASCMDSLPGFLELALIEITTEPLQNKSGPWGFIFNLKNPARHTHKKYRVAISHIEDYALALTARGDTVV